MYLLLTTAWCPNRVRCGRNNNTILQDDAHAHPIQINASQILASCVSLSLMVKLNGT